MHVCAHVPEGCLVSSSGRMSTSVEGSLIDLESLIMLAWLTRKPQGSSCLHLPNSGMLGAEPRPSCLLASTLLPEPPALQPSIYTQVLLCSSSWPQACHLSALARRYGITSVYGHTRLQLHPALQGQPGSGLPQLQLPSGSHDPQCLDIVILCSVCLHATEVDLDLSC